ncbi:16704_t:CDS:2, partial [Cetraspora pellucida]
QEYRAQLLLILPKWTSVLWWPMFLETSKEVVKLSPAIEIIIPGLFEQREPCRNSAWKLLAARIDWSKNEFCEWIEENVCPAKVEMIRMFLGWLKIAEKVSCMQDCLGVIAKLHKQKGFVNPVENVNVKK